MAKYIRKFLKQPDPPSGSGSESDPDIETVGGLAAAFIVGSFQEKYGAKRWTRVHSLQQRWAPRDETKRLVEDLAALKREMSNLDKADTSRWKPIFDPDAFKKANPGATLAGWAPDHENVELWGKFCVQLRTTFAEKAGQYPGAPAPEPDPAVKRRLPPGMKNSLGSNPNVGITEK